jgi:hypothetical protein
LRAEIAAREYVPREVLGLIPPKRFGHADGRLDRVGLAGHVIVANEKGTFVVQITSASTSFAQQGPVAAILPATLE